MSKFDKKFESASKDWETPPELFDILDKEFHFTIDIAADEQNAKVNIFYSKQQDALTKPWTGICWLNPPYGRDLKKWIKKAYVESRKTGTIIVMLIPSRTNTVWWHTYCMRASEIRFIKGRPKFVGAKDGLPQPLAIVVFKETNGKEPIFSSFSCENVSSFQTILKE